MISDGQLVEWMKLIQELLMSLEPKSETVAQEPMSKLHIKYEKNGLMVEAEVHDTQLIKVAIESILKALQD